MDSNQESKNTGAGSGLFTRRSMEHMSSPDQMKAYLRVTGLPVWIVVAAILLVLVGFFVWSSFVSITSFTDAKGVVKDDVLTVVLPEDIPDGQAAAAEQFIVRVGDAETTVSASGKTARGKTVATGQIGLPDGSYRVRIGYGKQKAIELLLN